MHPNNSVLDALVAELGDVTRHYMIQGRPGSVVVTAFVTADHVGPDVQTVPSTITTELVCIDGMGHTMSDALDDVLGKITLSAPQQVSA